MIAALYVQTNGVYYGLPDVDPWDEQRDARLYAGPHPVVAHPPCSRWCRLAGLVEKRWGHKKGEDGGCFEAALKAVRRWGGVLEHPAYSDAWQRFRLPVPSARGRWQQGLCGGWVTELDQAHFGHRARKSTWLYAFGTELPKLPRTKARGTIWISNCGNRNAGQVRERILKGPAAVTPIPFRDLLLSIARSAEARMSSCRTSKTPAQTA